MNILDEDFLLALELQEQLDKESWKPSQPVPKPDGKLSIVDESWETIDPNPDIRELFLQFNQEFFWGRLAGIEVRWSPRMTLCAGLCVYEGRGGLCSVRLSQPLLKLRPRKDLVETLLHEMIHAYLFVTDNNKDHDGHGPEFHKHMYRINNATGTNISVYHNFHDEVDHFRQHWWRCNGPCQNRKPFYGYVKRAMNRPPSERDPWWNAHKQSCNGTYIKIKEPEGYGKKKAKDKSLKEKETKKSEKQSNPDIRSFLGKGQTVGSSKVIVNGVLTNKESQPGPSKVLPQTNVVKGKESQSGPSKEGKNKGGKPPVSNSNSGNVNIKHTGVSKTSKNNERTSVSAINASGKISDKEIVRQKKLAALMLSDSDDDDLVLCDGPQSNEIQTSGGYIPKENNKHSNISSESDCELVEYSIDNKSTDVKNGTDTKVLNDTTNQSPRSVKVIQDSSHTDSDVTAKVRSVWANKQFKPSLQVLDPKGLGGQLMTHGSAESNSFKSKKRFSSGNDKSSQRKKLKKNESEQTTKIDDLFRNTVSNSSDVNQSSGPSTAQCPVCNQSIPMSTMNTHLDSCLGMT